jgi:hypothetical protein
MTPITHFLRNFLHLPRPSDSLAFLVGSLLHLLSGEALSSLLDLCRRLATRTSFIPSPQLVSTWRVLITKDILPKLDRLGFMIAT